MSKKNFKGKERTYSKSKGANYGSASRNANSRRNDANVSTSKDSASRNDLGWYVKNTTMMNNVSNIPFGYRTGDAIHVTMGVGDLDFIIPGINKIIYTPTIGYATNPGDPVNLAATSVYSYLRRFDSGAKVFEPGDLMIYLMAMDSCYAGIAWFQRLLSVAQTYSSNNRYLPHAVLVSMNVVPESVWGSLNEITNRLNFCINQVNHRAIPNTFDLFKRHMYLNLNRFLDEPNEKAQMYYFNPRLLYKFTYNDTTGIDELQPVAWDGGDILYSWQHYMTILEDLVNAVFIQEDSGVMSGAIEKAYGNNLFTLEQITPNINVPVLHDKLLMEQIHNMDIMGSTPIEDFVITQDVSSGSGTGLNAHLVSKPTVKEIGSTAKLLDVHTDPVPGLVMYATRLCCGTVVEEDEKRYATHCPTELVNEMKTYRFIDSDSMTMTHSTLPSNYVFFSEGDLLVASMEAVSYAVQSSYYPLVWGFGVDGEHYLRPFLFTNTDRTTRITDDNIDVMNRVALLGLFDVQNVTPIK